MKTIILTIVIAITAISCGQTETAKQPIKFKFYHADTNVEFVTASSMIEAMQKGKCYRLDVTTGECYNYTTNTK